MGNVKWAIDCFLTAAMSNGDDDQNNHNRPPPAAASSILATALSDNSLSGNRTQQRRVDHTYRDYSNFPLEELPTRKRAPTNFPSKLHQILSNTEYAHVSQLHFVVSIIRQSILSPAFHACRYVASFLLIAHLFFFSCHLTDHLVDGKFMLESECLRRTASLSHLRFAGFITLIP